jgi:beta-phosphoglucomutase
VVIENAPFGVASAKKAGMFCVGITTSLPSEYLKGADIVIDKLEELSAVIKGMKR